MNNNYDYNYELLFWKVFKNKYILNNIINQIHINEWIEYDNYKQINHKNRFKFKDIINLKFMLVNKLYSLIKYKINSNNDDYIYINKESIKYLFNQINDESNQEELLNLLLLFLEKKRIEFEICDLIKLSIECNNFKVLNILINEPYSIKFNKEIINLEFIIKNSNNLEILKLFYDKFYNQDNQDYNNNNNILKLAFENGTTEIINFIFSKYSNNNNNNNNNLIKFNTFLNLNCDKLKNKLMDLNLVQVPSPTSSSYYYSIKSRLNINQSLESLITSLRIHFKFNFIEKDQIINNQEFELKVNEILGHSSNEQQDKDKLKELQKLISISFKFDKSEKYNDHSFYIDYKFKYNESIKECEIIDKYHESKLNEKQEEIEFSKLIKECNIEKLKELDHNKSLASYKIEIPDNEIDIIKLINYLNDTGIFDPFHLLSKSSFYEKLSSSIIPIENINLNISNQIQINSISSMLICSLRNYKFGLSKLLIINLIKALKKNDDDDDMQIKFIQSSIDFRELLYQNKIYYDDYYHNKENSNFKQIYFNSSNEKNVIEIIISTIQILFDNYNNKDSIGEWCYIINHLYGVLIRTKGISSNQINQVIKLYNGNSTLLRIPHSQYHSFFYLSIKSLKFSKFILESLKSNFKTEYIKINYDQISIPIIKYLKPNIFTFDFISSASFEEILNKLEDQLIYDPFLKGLEDFNFLINSVLNTMKFYLEIKRIDLFFNQFKKVNKFLTFKGLQPSSEIDIKDEINTIPSNLLKSTSTLFGNKGNELLKIDNIYPFDKCSISIIKLACQVLKTNQEFELFIHYNFNVPNFLDTLFKYCSRFNRFEFVSLILDNFNFKNYHLLYGTTFYFLNFYFKNYINLISNNLNQLKLIYEKQPQDNEEEEEEEEEETEEENDDEEEYDEDDYYYDEEEEEEEEEENNIFIQSFIKGDIKVCNLILEYFPNYQFRVSKKTKTKAILKNNSFIIDYFKNLIN